MHWNTPVKRPGLTSVPVRCQCLPLAASEQLPTVCTKAPCHFDYCDRTDVKEGCYACQAVYKPAHHLSLLISVFRGILSPRRFHWIWQVLPWECPAQGKLARAGQLPWQVPQPWAASSPTHSWVQHVACQLLAQVQVPAQLPAANTRLSSHLILVQSLSSIQHSLHDMKKRVCAVECTPVQLKYGMIWYGMVWYGMVWYGMVWYVMCTVRYVMCMVWYVMSYTPYHTLCLLVEYIMTWNKLLHGAR